MVLWNFDLLWKNYGSTKKNYGTIPRTKEHRFPREKGIADFQKLRNVY